VVELLLKMGYGGIAGRGEVTRFHNDGGIDGIINQDVTIQPTAVDIDLFP
ncbi:MAG: hypothetical protein RJA81_850, partial [Planctomycetota bacterium]